MKTLPITLSLLSAALSCAPLTAQAYEAKLRPATEVAFAGRPLEITLYLEAKEDCKVPANVLAGLALKTTIDGKPGPKLTQAVAGQVALAAGTRIERKITLDLEKMLPNLNEKSVTRVGLQWEGLLGASAAFDVAPDMKGIDLDDLDHARTRVLLVTNYGEMVVKFRPDKAPKTVRNFLKLSKEGFYDGTRFHRVIRGFMIQGGCPNTKAGARGRPGTGNPGYSIDAEFNDIRHVKGVLSMARSSDPDSAGCQFFIVHAQAPHLDNQYTAFGELVSGEDVLDKIANVAVGGPQRSTPNEPVHLKAAVIQPVFKKK